MTVMTEISREIADLVAGNTLYQDYQARWKFLLEAYLGGDEWREGNHLTRYQLESDGEYRARLNATPYDNHVRSIISVYNSFLFREKAEREFGIMEPAPEVGEFLKDANLDGQSLDAVMKDIATWAAVFGHCWIIMAKPDIGAVTRADEIAQSIRPYINIITPLSVLDWSWSRSPNGRYELDYLKYVEDINGDVRTVKEWYKDHIRTIIVDTKENTKLLDESVPNGLGVIPAVISYHARSTVRGIGVSAISDIADACKFIYNATSEVDQSIRLDSHPSLVKTIETQAGVGAGAIIHMPEGMDPALKPYVLEFSGANIASIYQSITHTESTIDKMASVSGVRTTETRTVSGVALQTEFQLLSAKLSEMADGLELTEEGLWRLFCMYQGYPYEVEIDYPSVFEIRDAQNEVDKLVKMRGAATDPRVLTLIDHELIELMDEDADIIMPEMVTLSTGEVLPSDATEDFDEPEEMFNPSTGEKKWVYTFEEKKAALIGGWVE